MFNSSISDALHIYQDSFLITVVCKTLKAFSKMKVLYLAFVEGKRKEADKEADKMYG